MSPLRVLIVDDEPLARRRIRALLRSDAGFCVVAECGLGREAVQALAAGGLDAVFLDIRMPDMTGFEVLEAVGFERLPMVVFVTAHSDHALQAFDVCAVDYLLKPFEDERLANTLARLRRLAPHRNQEDAQQQLRSQLQKLVEHERRAQPGAGALVIRSGGRTTLLAPEEVRWVQADGCYVRVHTDQQDYLVRESMARIEVRLADAGFLRIHRSSIVRLAEVRELRKQHVALRDGTLLRVSERYWRHLRDALGM